MKKILQFIKSLFPEKIIIFSNNTVVKNVENSEIIISKTNKAQETISASEFDVGNLNLSDFTFNVKIDAGFHYEERFLKSNFDDTVDERLDFFLEEEIWKKIEDILNCENRIVILGNPGIGKTKELENLFLSLWNKKKKTGMVPFYLNIKNFGEKNDFEKLIKFDDWRLADKPCFIIDGLDEISNINYFISQLELFFSKNSNQKMKIVISCRTNIYEKYLINITDTKYYFLQALTDSQIRNILKNNFDIEITIAILNKFRVFLENPFTLNLFGSYYQENERFPNSISEAFELSIEKELNETKEKFKNRINVDIPFVKKDLMKVAFVNELMQQNQISEDDLSELIKREYKPIFEELPFLDRIPQSKSFAFRHKNYQEFFAAKYLSQFEAEKIVSTIRINSDINKTKPSLFNTITFLLNILEREKFDVVIDWLINNEPEILFLTEKDRIHADTQKEIFRKYFIEVAFEKTFWLGKNRRFSMEKLAEFADVDFLIETIKNNEHFRAVFSAIDMFMYIDEVENESELKKIITDLILENGKYKNEALRCFRERGYHLKWKESFEEITVFFNDDFDPEVNHQIIRMISDFENVDENFPTLKNCLHKLYGPERIKDDVIRGTDFILEKLIFKIENVNNFLTILDFVFNRKFSLKISDFYRKDFRDRLLEKSLFFSNNDKDFLFRVIDAFLRSEDSFLYRKDNFLFDLVNKTSNVKKCFQYIINKYGINNKTIFLLSNFENEDCIDFVAEKFTTGSLKFKEKLDINYLRNRFFANSRKIGYYFEDQLQNVGFSFVEKLPSKEKIEENTKKYEDFIQENFDILFNKEKLSKEISKVFDENEVEEMTWEKIHKISWKWYDDTNFDGLQNSVFVFIQNRLRNDHSKTKDQILRYLDFEVNLLYEIKNKIKNKASLKFDVKPKQIEYIISESLKVEQNFDFENIFIFKDEDHIFLKNNYHILKMLYFFDKEFDINFSNEFYLKTLRFCNIHERAEGNLDYIFSKVNDKVEFDKMVAHDINSEQMDWSTLRDHIDYALTNKLKDTYHKIGEFIISSRYINGDKEFLKRYIDLLPSAEQLLFLKKCCEDPNKYLCWEAIKLMQEKNIGNEFMHQLAKDYISSGDEAYFSNALDLLFYFNDIDALEVYLHFLKKFGTIAVDLRDDFYIKNTSYFKSINKLNLLKEIFDIIYDEKNNGTFDYHHSKANLENLISNLSSTEEGYNAVQNILKEIKANIKDKEGKFFYVNHLIDSSEQTYYNSLSQPLNFRQAKLIIERN